MKNIPKHIAIIMDGNGRWAEERGRPRVFGHVRGATRIRALVDEAGRLGVQALTLYAFSTENWSRPRSELDVLWKLLRKFLVRERSELLRKGVQLRVIGEVTRLSPDLQSLISESVDLMKGNRGLILTLAISYGGRGDLVRAVQQLSRECVESKRVPEELTESDVESHLWTGSMGELSEVDLLIRTSGEMRLSNFLLWQVAYAEFVFVPQYWPDFDVAAFRLAIDEFSNRDRRYGALTGASHSVETSRSFTGSP